MGEDVKTVTGLGLRFGTILIGAVASLGFVAFVGAVILWNRYEAAELPADQAVAVQPREDLVTVGGIALLLFVLGGLLAVLLLKLLWDPEGTASLPTRNGLLVVMLVEILAASSSSSGTGSGIGSRSSPSCSWVSWPSAGSSSSRTGRWRKLGRTPCGGS